MNLVLTAAFTFVFFSCLETVNCQCDQETIVPTTERCCRCIEPEAACNEITTEDLNPGYKCNEVDYDDEDGSCNIGGTVKSSKEGDDKSVATVIIDLLGLRAVEPGDQCVREGKQLCCTPLPQGVLSDELRRNGEREKYAVSYSELCSSHPAISAVQDFSKGVACGKRDSRVYHKSPGTLPTETNAGEFPWVVAIFDKTQKDPNDVEGRRLKFIGAGAYLDRDIVATVAHKMLAYQSRPQDLLVHLGDWDLRYKFENNYKDGEEFPHLELDVSCVKIHPQADLNGTLANNIAVIKLDVSRPDRDIEPSKVANVIDWKSTGISPGTQPGSLTTGEFQVVKPCDEYPKFYINSICLPRDEEQFNEYLDNEELKCYVAAWGSNPYSEDRKGQREVDLALLSRAECQRRLQPEFDAGGLGRAWEMQPSEICAGGVAGVDTCQGEGGSPLVCLDKKRDQFFAVGLVNYGFGCYKALPSVYVNLADPVVKAFLASAIRNEDLCYDDYNDAFN